MAFNLPFDISRLAVDSSSSLKGGGWSLCLTLRRSKKTGKMEIDPERPRIVLTGTNSKSAFVRLSSNRHQVEWRKTPRFLDLHTLAWALRDRSHNLNSACKAFGVSGKLKNHVATGRVTPKEIKYCREDVAATHRLLNAAKNEFDLHPVRLNPDEAYSPASIAKSYLKAMKLARPKDRFKISNKISGVAMQGYYGGRAECRIRKTEVPVVYTDFTSQYPTVNALLGNWDVLNASAIRFETATHRIKALLSRLTLATAFQKSFWKQLAFFALIKPDKDTLPVRTIYNGRTQNIGLNFLTSAEPVWYAGPDVAASILLTGKVPKILKAVRMCPRGRQTRLLSTNLGGMVKIDPQTDDFFVRMIEQRSLHKPKNKPLAHFLKILANSGSYGLYVQVDPGMLKKPKLVTVFSGTKKNDHAIALHRKDRFLVFSTARVPDHSRWPVIVSHVRALCYKGGRKLSFLRHRLDVHSCFARRRDSALRWCRAQV